MNQTTSSRCSIQCIIPPHMVDAIKLRGDAKQKKMALAIEKVAEKSREAREAAAPPQSFMAAPAVAAAAAPSPSREVYDGDEKAGLPGTLVRSEGDAAVADTAVNEAYDGAGDTYSLFFDIYNRDSLDGNGMTMVSTVHHRKNYNNAFWDGTQMAYGDGDGSLFTGFTSSLSVIGHELSHAVVQHSGGLIYRDQSGALNESFADVFGVLTVQYKLGLEAHEADWLVGDGLLAPGVNGEALRSMKAPGTAYDDPVLGKDPQPFHMDNFIITTADRGGVHWNSGIPNHAFYLLAQYLGGKAWVKAGKIWYDTMQDIQNPHATFQDWADKTVEIARNLYGAGSLEAQYTRRAWKLVGINV